MKTEFTHNQCWKTKNDLRKYLSGCLTNMESGSEDLQSVMLKENTRLKEICEFYKIEELKMFNV